MLQSLAKASSAPWPAFNTTLQWVVPNLAAPVAEPSDWPGDGSIDISQFTTKDGQVNIGLNRIIALLFCSVQVPVLTFDTLLMGPFRIPFWFDGFSVVRSF